MVKSQGDDFGMWKGEGGGWIQEKMKIFKQVKIHPNPSWKIECNLVIQSSETKKEISEKTFFLNSSLQFGLYEMMQVIFNEFSLVEY